MERDFLGIHVDNLLLDSSKGNNNLKLQDAGSILWPFSNRLSTIQQSQEERPSSSLTSSRKFLGVDRQGVGRYPVHGCFPTSSPWSKAQSVRGLAPNSAFDSPEPQPSRVGSYAPRSMFQHNAMTDQLTIFYGGNVNVFDDVPFDKVQAIMSLFAKKQPNKASNAAKTRPESTLPVPNGFSARQTFKFYHPTSVTINEEATSPHSGSRINNNTTWRKVTTSPISATQQETYKAQNVNKPRAISQARRASLIQFLEKRRMNNAMPYSSSSKISPENGSGFEGCDLSSTPTNYQKDYRFGAHQKMECRYQVNNISQRQL